ncbi:MAG: hypothetical protein J7621_19130 [Niastella sp.]|nr:hypothetical protein [Niastella sp.]
MDEKKIPDFLLKLTDGCSIYAQVATKYWVVCALLSILTLSVQDLSGAVKLPFDLPELSKVDFFPFMFLIISVLFIVFGSSTAQAIRARMLINRFIYSEGNNFVLPAKIYLPDVIDVILYPAINRVAPLVQVLQPMNKFLPEANEISSSGKKSLLIWYYGFLKVVSAIILYGLPSFALIYCIYMVVQFSDSLSWITKTLLIIVSPLVIITLVTLILLDIDYTSGAMRKIKGKKVKKV